jgi:hypothetical protein
MKGIREDSNGWRDIYFPKLPISENPLQSDKQVE